MKKIIDTRKARKWSDEKIQFLKDNYNKLSYKEISDYLGFTYSAISHKAHRLGLDSRNKWSEEENNILKNNYPCNPNVWDLLPNRSREAIKQQARKIGVQRECGNYSINHNFFSKWTRESSYVIGFLLADGCVEPHLNRISCELSIKDYEQLFKIKTLLQSENPIYMKKTRDACVLYIHNRKMLSDVINKGVMPKKTSRARLPNIPNEFLPDLLRGYIDGDGSIYRENNDYLRIQILGNKKMMENIKNKIFNLYSISTSNPRIHNKGSEKCWDIKISGEQAQKLTSILYNNCNDVMMERKYEKTKVPARGVIPRKINPAQISQVNTSSIEEPERKTDYFRLARRDYTQDSKLSLEDGIVQ